MRLDIGEFPDDGDVTASAGNPTRPVELTAHAVARIADRMPFSRRISRHMEGTDNKAGILSDVFALLTELVRRNPDLIESRLEAFGDELAKARDQRTAAKQQQQTSTEGINNNAA